MMFRVPNRAIKYAVITNYAIRDALQDIDVDLSSVEATLQDTVSELSAKVQMLIDKLEALEESQPDGPQETTKGEEGRRKTARKGDSKA